MDTASFIVHIKLEHVYEDLVEEVVERGSTGDTQQKYPYSKKKKITEFFFKKKCPCISTKAKFLKKFLDLFISILKKKFLRFSYTSNIYIFI